MLSKSFSILRSFENHNLFEVPTLKWNSTEWSSVKMPDLTEIIEKKISFMTYNVWFEEHNFTNRVYAIFQLLEKYSADFICLQEVTRRFLNNLLDQKFIRDNYHVSGNFQHGYDVIIISKLPVKFYVQKFQKSNMTRKLLIAETFYNCNGEVKPILIGTSHLESLNNPEFRKSQLEIIFRVLEKSDSSFLMGDFNFDPSWENEQKNLNPKYLDSYDTWKSKNKLMIEGYTMPKNDLFPAWRPDRILYKNFNLDFFEIFGNEPIELEEATCYSEVKTPSDHYGLYSRFSLNEI